MQREPLREQEFIFSISLTCCGVRELRRGGLGKPHAAQEGEEVGPERRCHRLVALFSHAGERDPTGRVYGVRRLATALVNSPKERETEKQINAKHTL